MLKRGDEKLIHGLRRRKMRADNGLFLAEGVRVVEELAASSIDLRLALVSPSLEDNPRGRALARTLAERVRTERVSDPELSRLAATDAPQGVLAIAEIPAAPVADWRLPERATVLALDAVQDPGNFGTLLRCADAFGTAAVIALPGTVDAWNPKAVRASAGSSFRVPILELTTPDAMAWLRGQAFTVYGADATGAPLEALASGARRALVVGNEGAGLGEETRSRVDALVSIPMAGRAESLNVSVAAGILLYLMTREN